MKTLNMGKVFFQPKTMPLKVTQTLICAGFKLVTYAFNERKVNYRLLLHLIGFTTP